MSRSSGRRFARLLAALGALALTGAAPPSVESEVARARALAGADFADSLFLCDPSSMKIADMLAQGPAWTGPVRAFDNLWYIGNSFVGAWVLKTSEGLVLIDALASEGEVREHLEPGLRAIGLEPADISYAVVTHGHWDHYGGAKYLQERYGTRIVLGAEDWDLLERSPPGSLSRAPYFGADRADRVPPKRDIVVRGRQTLRVGDATIRLFVTPGHSPGTLSALVPVKDGKHTHLMSLLGGTAFPRTLEPHGDMGGLRQFEDSVELLRRESRKAGAAGLLNTHIFVDGTDRRLAAATMRRPGEANPFLLGRERVTRYYGMFLACLRAAELRPTDPAAPPPMPSAKP